MSSSAFKFEKAEETQINTIKKVAKLDTYVVAYNDSQGREEVRLVMHKPGTKGTYILQNNVSGSKIVSAPNLWFQRELERILNPEQEVESV